MTELELKYKTICSHLVFQVFLHNTFYFSSIHMMLLPNWIDSESSE